MHATPSPGPGGKPARPEPIAPLFKMLPQYGCIAGEFLQLSRGWQHWNLSISLFLVNLSNLMMDFCALKRPL